MGEAEEEPDPAAGLLTPARRRAVHHPELADQAGLVEAQQIEAVERPVAEPGAEARLAADRRGCSAVDAAAASE